MTQTFYWDVAALPDVTAGTSGVQYRIGGISRNGDDGLYSCYIDKIERQTQTVAQYVTEEGAAERTLEQSFLGVRDGDLDDAGEAVGLQSMTLEAGKIKTRRRRKNADCTQDIEEQERLSVNQTATDGEARADQTSETVIATQADAEVAATPEAGKIVRARNRPTAFGKLATEKETITPVPQTVTHTSESRADQTAETAWAKNAAAKADATAVTGKIVRATSRENEFGKFDNSVETITPAPQTVTHTSESRADQTASTEWAKNAAAKADAMAVTGKIVRATSRENEFGKFDNSVETITPVPQTATDGEARADQTSETVIATQADAEVAATPEAGKIVRARNRPTAFGKFATEKETITPVPQTVTHTSESRADQTAETAWAKNAAAKADATAVTGKIVRATSRENEFGKFDNSVETITPAPQTVTHTSESRADQTAETAWAKNAAAKADATAVTGKIVRATSRENEFGKFDNSVETITPAPQTVTHTSESRADQTASTEWAKNAAAKADATAVTGKIVRATSRENEFGKFDNSVETITPAPQTVTHTSESRADQTAETAWAKNAAAKADATAVTGKIVRATSRENEFGKFDNSVETITPAPQTVTHTSESRADQTAETAWAKNAAAKADATAVTGKIVRATSLENEFGKFDNSVETITPAPQTVTHTSESRADQTAETVWAKNAAAKADATAVTGKIVRATSRENEFGKFDNSVETITPEPQTATDGEARADQTSETVIATQADAEVAATPEAGKIVRARNRPTAFGKFATEKETITPVPQTVTHTSESRADQTASTEWAKNAAAKADATAVTGKIVRATSRENEFGKFDNSVETITPDPQSWSTSVATKRGARKGTLTAQTFRNQAAGYCAGLMAGLSAEAEVSPHVSVNAFGLEDGSLTVWVPDTYSVLVAQTTIDSWSETLQEWDGTYHRHQDFVDEGTGAVTTKVQEVTFTHYYQLCDKHSEAMTAVEGMANLAEYTINLVRMRNGRRMWLARGKSAPTAYGAWADAPAPA